jgi:hypothetical protein
MSVARGSLVLEKDEDHMIEVSADVPLVKPVVRFEDPRGPRELPDKYTMTFTNAKITVSHIAPGDYDEVQGILPDKYDEFVRLLGEKPDTDALTAAIRAVKAGRIPELVSAIDAVSQHEFVWYDWDSPFYGDGGN